MIFYIDLSC